MDNPPHHLPHSSSTTMTAELKRKRSPSHDAAHVAPAPPPKAAKSSNHLQINYLARQYQEDLPLISNDDNLPSILQLLGEYQGVLDRHESMACNLGARPLGPILIKRFERLFDGPPKVLKSHGKDGATVTWLDVVDFARNKPEQFTLGQMSEGLRVCQFYTKQCRVQISEEDFVLISSGIPQKMIPPQPIVEDEEKELGTLEILEKNLAQVCQLADQVAARTRQLNHRLKGRKQAILDRRATNTPAAVRASSPSNVALMNGLGQNASAALAALNKSPSQGGFVAVNTRPPPESNGPEGGRNGASPATHSDLLSKFTTVSDRRGQPSSNGEHLRRGSGASLLSAGGQSSSGAKAVRPASATSGPAGSNGLPYTEAEYSQLLLSNASPIPIPSTPANLLSYGQRAGTAFPQPTEKDDGGPFKAEMVARMESLSKGERILPPCDRCRRLHMDCLKNLTACMGCTKKHAKCSWKEVREPELRMSQIGEGEQSHSDVEMTGYPGAVMRQSLASPTSASPSASVASVGQGQDARMGGTEGHPGHATPQPTHAEPPRQERHSSAPGESRMDMTSGDGRVEERLLEAAQHQHSGQSQLFEHQGGHGLGQEQRRDGPEASGPSNKPRSEQQGGQEQQQQHHQSNLQSLVA